MNRDDEGCLYQAPTCSFMANEIIFKQMVGVDGKCKFGLRWYGSSVCLFLPEHLHLHRLLVSSGFLNCSSQHPFDSRGG